MNQLHDIVLEQELNKYFGFSSFREGQKEIIQSVLNQQHTLGTLPTGSGKSICYQLPALLLEGLTVIVSPLISLMIDQVKLLKYQGIKRVTAINSLLNTDEKLKVINRINQYKMIYCSPEMLQQPFFIKRLKEQNVSLFVIDEAHCISQWGHEFRPDYLRLKDIIKELNHPTVLALSATATPSIQQDIVKHLDLPMNKIIYPIDRTNITFTVTKVTNDEEKYEKLLNVLKDYRVPTMVYFSSRTISEKICRKLQVALPDRRIAFYHGGMSQEDRILIQQQFMLGQLDVICCTSAFGMGINKNDIRLVVHYHLPSTIESLIQEIGRAGRDGSHSVSLLLYAPGDEIIPYQLIDTELPQDYLINQYIQLRVNSGSDEVDIEGLTETHARFLSYHFEKLSDHHSIDEIFNQICLIKDDRTHVKKKSILRMLHWIHGEHCRRKQLFHFFQDNIQAPLFACCDNCGFQLSDDWEVSHLESTTYVTNWQERLELMFNKRWNLNEK